MSSYPTDPNTLGPTQTLLKTFWDIKVYFKTVFKDFHTFSIQKSFYKKKVCLPTDPKKFGHVTGNKAFFSFGLISVTRVNGKSYQIYVKSYSKTYVKPV